MFFFLLSSSLLYCLYFVLYLENQEIFCSCVWIQICRTSCNLIYCSFVGFCVLILPLVLSEFKQILVPRSISIAWSAWIHLMLRVKVGHNLLSNFFLLFLLSNNVSLLSEMYFYLLYFYLQRVIENFGLIFFWFSNCFLIVNNRIVAVVVMHLNWFVNRANLFFFPWREPIFLQNNLIKFMVASRNSVVVIKVL